LIRAKQNYDVTEGRAVGRPLATHEEGEQRAGPVLGLEALAPAAYVSQTGMTLLLLPEVFGTAYDRPAELPDKED
jgi:hypothetical protein